MKNIKILVFLQIYFKIILNKLLLFKNIFIYLHPILE